MEDHLRIYPILLSEMHFPKIVVKSYWCGILQGFKSFKDRYLDLEGILYRQSCCLDHLIQPNWIREAGD